MDRLLHLFGRLFNYNYGLAIIAIVLIVRFILLPFMLIQVKICISCVRKRRSFNLKLIKLEKIKEADSQEERNAANQLLMKNISNMVSIHLKILSVVSLSLYKSLSLWDYI